MELTSATGTHLGKLCTLFVTCAALTIAARRLALLAAAFGRDLLCIALLR
jgi:hypothetical protein